MPLSGTEREHPEQAAAGLGARVVTAEIARTGADGSMMAVHDPVLLASALATSMPATAGE